MQKSPALQLPRPITLIVNTNSRRGRSLFQQAVAAVRQAEIPLAQACPVRSKEESQRLLRREVSAGANLVIVGGGDGTLSGCAAHLVGTTVALGVLPMGTGNTLARSLGIPLGLPEAAATIAAGHIETMDVGRANGRVFLNSVTLGLSAEIAGALDRRTKRRLGLLAWPVVGARVVYQHRPMIVTVSSPDETFHARTHQVIVANGRYLAGPLTAAPDASIRDSSLRVFVLGGAGARSLLRAALQWATGRHTTAKDTHYFETRQVRIESRRRPLRADIDGELDERTPLDITLEPRALRVVVPEGFRPTEV